MAECEVSGKTKVKKALRMHAEDETQKKNRRIVKSYQVRTLFNLSSWKRGYYERRH